MKRTTTPESTNIYSIYMHGMGRLVICVIDTYSCIMQNINNLHQPVEAAIRK